MNSSVREIYADYRYSLLKIGMILRDMSLEQADTAQVQPLLERAERLETLIDLYAYLVACQGDSSRR
jgi:hypothetical protein